MGTEIFGTGGYEESQTSHCECKLNDQVGQHYADMIDRFYAQHVPEKGGQGKSVVEKSKYAVNKGTEASPVYMLYRILYELMKKYDQGIKHAEGRINRKIVRPKSTKAEL